MREHRLEVADVFRQHGEEFLNQWGRTLSLPQRKALRDIGVCRTAALGGHLEECDHCARGVIAYNSCRNRHCPKCQATARDEWLAERAKELLPVPYCHVVFTIPQQLAPLALQNQRVCYSLLFRAVSETLQEIAADPRHLGAKIGFLAVLHTWSQNLLHHPHVHCVVPAGGLSSDNSRWISCRPNFFLPVRVLSRLFRGKLLAFLRQAYAEGKLKFFGKLAHLAEPARFHVRLRESLNTEWVVYAKPPFGGPQEVLKYLARYTHRVAISSSRLLSLDQGRVTFRWRDSKSGNQMKSMTLDAVEFIRRFLLHILPLGFVKIRHFGFLANRNRAAALALCRDLLKPSADHSASILTPEQRSAVERRCPFCHAGVLRIVQWLSPDQMSGCQPDRSPVDPVDSS
ncbi:MAG TPA: IS91 family transposase [Candidatus Sulfotelmatobacter sp.]